MASYSSFFAPGEAPAAWGQWRAWGDQGDGTYANPVLPSDYSDLDCIRVSGDYYALSSTFQFSPGLIILHSRDLVNWTIRAHALDDITQIGPEMGWQRMTRYGRGVWAGALRYHNGRFYIYFGTPDEGYFVTSAPQVTGPWEPLAPVLRGPGWDDCCPFWDEDGQGYLVGTHFADGYKIHLFKLTPDGRGLVPGYDRVIHQSRGSEANKLYKINGLYYHFFSEVRAGGRAVMMERAATVDGPYREIRQLSQVGREAHEPNQGGLVQTPDGAWYFFTHHGRGDWEGRAASLLPVTWVDGWPVIGAVGSDGLGSMVWGGRKPVAGGPVVVPQTSDDFDTPRLSPQWEWNYQPRREKWSLTERPGWLRLHAFTPLAPDTLLKAGNTLTQRTFRTVTNRVVVKVDLRGMADGQRAGLCHFASPHLGTLGIAQEGGVRHLEHRTDAPRASDTTVPGPALSAPTLWLASTWGLDGLSQFAYSLDGTAFTDFGPPYPLRWGSYRGDRIGLYCFNNRAETGYLDIDFLHYPLAPLRPA